MSGSQFSGGWIEVVAGVMFSGKSEELMRRVRRALIARKRVQVFKSHLDSRYAGLFAVSSHDGRTVEAVPVDSSSQVAQRISVRAVGQFDDWRQRSIHVRTTTASLPPSTCAVHRA